MHEEKGTKREGGGDRDVGGGGKKWRREKAS